MSINRSVIKVFLASPGDLTDERRAAKRIIEEENTNHANAQDYQFELVGWEDAVAQHGRAQEIINRDLDQCNFFIGVVWKRWGTPPGAENGEYSSGFEEEYERSEGRFNTTGRPSISLLFKNISDDDKRDVGPQLEKVLAFKKRFTDGYRGAYQTFDDIRDFEQRFRAVLAMFLRKQIEEDREDFSKEKSRIPAADKKQGADKARSGEALFEQSSQEFVSDLVQRSSDGGEYKFSPTEAARFRLLANTLQLSANDDETLGVHDANLMYRYMRDEPLSERERRGLLKAGLTQFSSQTTPFWHWLDRQAGPARDELAFRTIAGGEVQRKNAFRVLSLLSEQLHELTKPLHRQELIEWWLKSENDGDLVVAALGYLGDCGSIGDLEAIDGHLDSSETKVSRAAVSAKVQILARTSIAQALDFVASREDADLSKGIVSILLASPSTIETSLLKKCITSRSVEFRRAVAGELLNRDSIGAEDARMLVESGDAKTRLVGAKSLRRRLLEFSLSDARASIVKPKKENSLGLFPSISDRDYDGEDAFDEYKHQVLCERSFNEPVELRDYEVLYKHDVSFALYDRYFSSTREELIENIEDDFETLFARKRAAHPDSQSAPDEKVEAYIRGVMLQKALELLCTKKSRGDLALVRRKLDGSNIKFSGGILKFLERFGAWEDVVRIVNLVQNPPFRGMSLLSVANRDEDYADSAKAMLKLGRDRVGDLLATDMPSDVRNAVLREMAKSSFESFDDGQIEGWLRSQIDSVRKTVALKAVLCLPKTRLENRLKRYTSVDERYYYNAVFWLDLGVAVSKANAVMVAKRELLLERTVR